MRVFYKLTAAKLAHKMHFLGISPPRGILEVAMMPRLICIALFLACSFGCSRDSTPTSTESLPNSSSAIAAQNAPVHTTVVLTQEVDYHADGTIDQTAVLTTSYDQRGNALKVVSETDRAGRIIRRVTTASYNKWGNVLEQTIYSDAGDVAYWFTTVETDKKGQPVRQLGQEPDYNNDGVPETFSTRFYPAYDLQGRPLQEIVESDNDADGTLETSTTNTMTYDHRGNVERLTSDADYQMDGSSELGYHTVSTYNKYGEVVYQVTEFYDVEEGVTHSEMTTTEFDDHGNPVTRSTVDDYAPADGVVDAREIMTTSFDARNRPLTVVIERSIFGTNDSLRLTRSYQYFGTLAPSSVSNFATFSSAHSTRAPFSGEDGAEATEIAIPKPRR